ncbi:Glucokinase [bioreactor metagenome]|uniref:Glucokinase n=1 Tax=bioreactor metagenome TaxID=1076179 RepID=A0A644VJD4_9ZZZZ
MKSYSIGIDIGGTNTGFGLVDEKGNIISTTSISTKDFDIVENYLDEIVKHIILLIERCEDKSLLKGVGIGAPNGNYYNGTIEHAPNLKFHGIIPVKEYIETKLKGKGYDLKVTLTNDANAAAIGEMIYGGAKGIKNFIMITLGTGVGSGIVVDGKVVYGFDGFAGEVGHTIVQPEGRMCGCGRRGCVETYSSVTGLRKTALELINNTKTKSSLREICQENIGGKAIYNAAINGDKLALKCFEITAKMLAIGMANAVAVTSPEKIFLFGGLTKAGDLLMNPLKKYFEESLFVVFQNKIDLEISHLDENTAAILGAAALTY